MKKTRVLFVCVHNSARSQMAEAWLDHLHGDLIRGPERRIGTGGFESPGHSGDAGGRDRYFP